MTGSCSSTTTPTSADPAPYRPDAFELASGLVAGVDGSAPPLALAVPPQHRRAGGPRRGFEDAVLLAVARPPCAVSFSGGRDSSAVLAVAAAVARREGLPAPVPVTHRFPGDGGSDEADWQEQVVRHLGLREWTRHTWTTEMDVIGHYAGQLLRRWGPVYPNNAHILLPVAEAAAGGSVLTGVGGDEVFLLRSLATDLRRVARTPSRGTARAFADHVRPRAAWAGTVLPWLTGDANAELRRQLAAEGTGTPLTWRRLVATHWWRSRTRRAAVATLDAVAALHGAVAVHPFCSAEFLAAAARRHAVTGYGNRNAGMLELFAADLPRAVLLRRSKASFTTAFFGAPSRSWVETWDGTGVDPDLVDADRLLETWRADTVDARSFNLLQGVWAATTSAPVPAPRPAG